MITPIDYSDRISYYAVLLDKISQKNRFISVARLILFMMAAVSIYFVAVYATVNYVLSVILVSVISFVLLVRYHSKIIRETRLLEAYLALNKNEAKAMKGDYSSFPNGREFQEPEHPFAFDIDLFGDGSLFQFLNRTITRIGRERLAEKLMVLRPTKTFIKNLQTFIGFLEKQFEWRQQFQAIGMAHSETDQDKERILEWVQLPPLFNARIFKVLVLIVPVLTVFFTVMLAIQSITFQNYLLYLVIPWGIAGAFTKKTNTRHSMVSKTSDMLVKYSLLLGKIDALKSKQGLPPNEELQKIDSADAGKQLKVLSSILNALDNRINPVSWTLLNAIFLWDILQMLRLEKWQRKNEANLPGWFNLIAEMDALISLANFNFNHPETVFPDFAVDDEIIVAQDLGHPLIGPDVRVDNNVNIRKGRFVLITGANMAGKSTYLRTIATSLVMAMNGCKVIAKSYHFKPILLSTSIRTQDSLQKNESYFYAELKRLKQIIDALRSGSELFIILDEILKGTNSKDKHQGSEALLKQLISLKTSGIVATHDILLGELEHVFPEHISNYCFEVDISGQQLTFDYKLREGISKNMNATMLMRQMGITI